MIERGAVKVNGQVITKASQKVSQDSAIEITEENYVSRGAYKLIKAIDIFNLDFQDKVIADVGASTGGFTEVSLSNGASKVYCIDVGEGQLVQELRDNPKVANLEKTNIKEAKLDEPVDFCVVDLSFISILKVIDDIMNLLKPEGKAVVLIKPQFEQERKSKDVLKESEAKVLFDEVKTKLSEKYKVLNETISPIKGKEGNTEYLIEMCSAD
jgi:23S rRNA (cytidine1920-2'-O)/16S rRNA (cytidine1409-2'-O)-methyltransferase